MKKSKIFIAAGTFALAITAMFATKANKKFGSGVTSAYINGNSSAIIHFPSGAAFTTTSSGNKLAYATLYTKGGTTINIAGTLYTAKASSSNKPVFFH